MSKTFALDKSKIRQSFGAASSSYDGVAGLQRAVGKELLRTINGAKLIGTLLDLGCGTGFLTGELLASLRCEQMVALDIALPMLHTTRNKLRSSEKHENVQYLCADAEQLPFADQVIDGMFSNLALQWCRTPEAVFADIKRVLKAEGQLIFSTFGPETLKELKAAWAEVDGYHHVNEFYSEGQLEYFLQQAGFRDLQVESKLYISSYGSVLELMKELKHMGAHNVSTGRNKQITTKTQMQGMITAYEKHRTSNLIPATFEVIMVAAK
ncbi:MAG: malonyl-ACP O-methyltransferase BioC [Methylobacter sp.]|jgi:malonyl-CoA O-methyltransferase